MKNHKKLERIPLESMEDESSDESLRGRHDQTETHFAGRSAAAQSSHHHRSYSMDTTAMQTLRQLPSRNVIITGVNAKSTFELRRRKSSLVSAQQMGTQTQSTDVQIEEMFSFIENDASLMEDNPLSEHMRIETLKNMPTSLTLKRSLKHKLGTSVRKNSNPLSLWKRLKYFLSMYFSKLKMEIKDLLYVMNLWYGSIKVIEGHFGTSTATYFKFFRWLFLINSIMFIISFGFLVIPQLLFHLYEPTFNQNYNISQEYPSNYPEPDPYEANGNFSIGNIFTGEGWLEKSELYYGFYSNRSLSIISEYKYSIPGSYIFTMAFCYILTFILIATNAAKSYRRSYIETGGGVKHVYSHKLFCGWDFGIATEEGANLKRQSLYNEFKELLDEEVEKLEKESNPKNFLSSVTTLTLQTLVNFIVIVILGSTGVLMWILLSIHKTWEVAESNADSEGKPHPPTITVSLLVTFILLLVPMFFSYITRLERYQSPRIALYVTLWRTFGLEVVVLSVLLAFWLHSPDSKCWETSLGQEVYRLVIMDFLITICGKSAAELIRSRIYWSFSKKIGLPEFDIAQNTLILIYNQTLFWIGFFFSPLLSFIIVLKMFITFYIKKFGVMSHCRPSSRAWRAAQTETIFLVLSFLSLFGCLFAVGFAFTRVPASQCGPFRGYSYMYQMVLIEIFTISQESTAWNVLSYLLRPGVVGCVLVSMCVGIYYLRAVAMARVKMVKKLREMLVMEAKDKEYLLNNILKVTEGCFGPSKQFTREGYSRKEYNRSHHNANGEPSNINHMENMADMTQMSNLEDSLQEDEYLITYNNGFERMIIPDDERSFVRNHGGVSIGGHHSREYKGHTRHKR